MSKASKGAVVLLYCPLQKRLQPKW